MTRKSTAGTVELPLSKRHLINSSTTTASLARPSRVDLCDTGAACYSLVLQHPYESSPRSVSNGTSQVMVFDHIGNLQVLNSDAAEMSGQSMAEFVQEVTPLVADFNVLLCQPKASLIPVMAAFLLPTESPVEQLESLLGFDQKTRIAYSFSIGQGSEVFQPNINADLLRRRMLNYWNFNFAGECGEPLPSLITLYGESFDFAFWNSVQNDWNVSYLRSMKPFVTDKFKTFLWVSDALNPALKAGETLFPTFRIFYPVEKVQHSLANPVRNILNDLGINTFGFSFQKLVKIVLAKRLARFLISLNAQLKKLIVNRLTTAKLFEENFLLLLGGIQAVTIHPEFHNKRYVKHLFKYCDLSNNFGGG